MFLNIDFIFLSSTCVIIINVYYRIFLFFQQFHDCLPQLLPKVKSKQVNHQKHLRLSCFRISSKFSFRSSKSSKLTVNFWISVWRFITNFTQTLIIYTRGWVLKLMLQLNGCFRNVYIICRQSVVAVTFSQNFTIIYVPNQPNSSREFSRRVTISKCEYFFRVSQNFTNLFILSIRIVCS